MSGSAISIGSTIGPQGARGYQGSQGVTGSQGPQGNTGLTGPQGYQGVRGYQGYQGSTGPMGSQGSQGAQGDQGATGSQGSQGNRGYQGPQGDPGGPQGSQGSQGPQGPQGQSVSVGRGSINARPDATAVTAGYQYFATDVNGGTLFQSDGSTWVKMAPGVDEDLPVAGGYITGWTASAEYGLTLTSTDGTTGYHTVNVDWSLANIFYYTLANHTTLTFSNMRDGQMLYFQIKQGSTAYTLTWPSYVSWPNGVTPTMSETASRTDLYTITRIRNTYYGTFAQNYVA